MKHGAEDGPSLLRVRLSEAAKTPNPHPSGLWIFNLELLVTIVIFTFHRGCIFPLVIL